MLFRERRGGFRRAQRGCGVFFRQLIDPAGDNGDLLPSHRRLIQRHSGFLVAPEIKDQRTFSTVPRQNHRSADDAALKDRFR